jgi:hypothetical protein
MLTNILYHCYLLSPANAILLRKYEQLAAKAQNDLLRVLPPSGNFPYENLYLWCWAIHFCISGIKNSLNSNYIFLYLIGES